MTALLGGRFIKMIIWLLVATSKRPNHLGHCTIKLWQIATLYTRASNTDKALEWLENAYKEHDNNMYSISADPIFDEISSDPRFLKLLKDMNLPLP